MAVCLWREDTAQLIPDIRAQVDLGDGGDDFVPCCTPCDGRGQGGEGEEERGEHVGAVCSCLCGATGRAGSAVIACIGRVNKKIDVRKGQ